MGTEPKDAGLEPEDGEYGVDEDAVLEHLFTLHGNVSDNERVLDTEKRGTVRREATEPEPEPREGMGMGMSPPGPGLLSLPPELLRTVLQFLLYTDSTTNIRGTGTRTLVPPPSPDQPSPFRQPPPNPALLHPLLLACKELFIHASSLLYSSVPAFISSGQNSLPFLSKQLSPSIPEYRLASYSLIRNLDIAWAGEDFYQAPMWKRTLASLKHLNALTLRHAKSRSRARRERHGQGQGTGDPDSSALLPAILSTLASAAPEGLTALNLIGFAFDPSTRSGLNLLKPWTFRKRTPSSSTCNKPLEKAKAATWTSRTSLNALSLTSCTFALSDLADLLSPPDSADSGSWLESLAIEQCTITLLPESKSANLGKRKWNRTTRRETSSQVVVELEPPRTPESNELVGTRRVVSNELAPDPELEAGDGGEEEEDEESFFLEAYAPGPFLEPTLTESKAKQPTSVPLISNPSESNPASTIGHLPATESNALPALFSTILTHHAATLHTISLLRNSLLLSFSPISLPLRPILPLLSSLPALRNLAVDFGGSSVANEELVTLFSGVAGLEYLHLLGLAGDKTGSLTAVQSVGTVVLQASAQPSLEPLAKITGLKDLWLLDCRDLLWSPSSLDSLCPLDPDAGPGPDRVFLRLGALDSRSSLEQGAWFSSIISRGWIGAERGRRVPIFRVERAGQCNRDVWTWNSGVEEELVLV